MIIIHSVWQLHLHDSYSETLALYKSLELLTDILQLQPKHNNIRNRTKPTTVGRALTSS